MVTRPKQRFSVVEPIREINRIKIVDNGEPLVGIADRCPDILLKDEPNDLGIPPLPYLREAVVEMLLDAYELLPDGYNFFVSSAYRAPEHQWTIYEWVYEKFKADNPHWPKNILRRETNRYVHPPDIPTPPGHSTGGAVDLTIVDPDGEELDMVSPYEGDRDDRRPVAATYDPKISEAARQNRELLIRVMSAAGFTNYAGEWWHWSYGDSCWAWRVGKSTAIYGMVEPTDEIRALMDFFEAQSEPSAVAEDDAE